MSNVPYFKTTEIGEHAWQIEYNYTDRQHVYCYLVEGRDYALVIDTMYGIGDLRKFCATLTSKPLKLANTHFHFDHCAGNFDFDECYMHHRDIAFFYDSRVTPPSEAFERAKAEAFDEYREQMEVGDFSSPRDMKVYPIYDGDVFDLGDRQIETIAVGGHSPGSVVFLDRKLRIAFTGDACNGNTLLGFGNALPIEEYLNNLLHFRRFRADFDIMYGGHQVLPPETLDEAIELCGRVLAGSDDREERPGMFGRTSIYAARHASSGFERADGKHFNMSYDPERRFGKRETKQVITLEPVPMF